MFVLIKYLLFLYLLKQEFHLSSISVCVGSSVNHKPPLLIIFSIILFSILDIKSIKSRCSLSNKRSEYTFLPVIFIPFFVFILGV